MRDAKLYNFTKPAAKKMTRRRRDGQVLNCEYGHHWPLNLFTSGYVQIRLKATRKGKVKVTYTWAEERAELVSN
jgi:hypothetical protein